MTTDEPLVLILGIITGLLALARAVRLVVDDDYPPMLWAKKRYINKVGADSQWVDIMECPWCCAPYLAAPAVGWFATLVAWPGATWNIWLWWLVNAWAAVSWIAAYLSLRDIPPESR